MVKAGHATTLPPQRDHVWSGPKNVGHCIMPLFVVATPFRHRDLKFKYFFFMSICRFSEPKKIVACPALLFCHIIRVIGVVTIVMEENLSPQFLSSECCHFNIVFTKIHRRRALTTHFSNFAYHVDE